jgi:ribosomal protein L37AE/L43A
MFADDLNFTEISRGEPTSCPDCGSTNTGFYAEYGFWECVDCGSCWGYDKDDPDYDEVDEATSLSGSEAEQLRDFLDRCLASEGGPG